MFDSFVNASYMAIEINLGRKSTVTLKTLAIFKVISIEGKFSFLSYLPTISLEAPISLAKSP